MSLPRPLHQHIRVQRPLHIHLPPPRRDPLVARHQHPRHLRAPRQARQRVRQRRRRRLPPSQRLVRVHVDRVRLGRRDALRQPAAAAADRDGEGALAGAEDARGRGGAGGRQAARWSPEEEEAAGGAGGGDGREHFR